MSKTTVKRALTMPSVAEDTQLRAAAKADPDALPLTAAQLKAMLPLNAVRGRPPSSDKKQLVSVRYSQEVLTYFRGTGAGWQARMNGALLEYIAAQSQRGAKGTG